MKSERRREKACSRSTSPTQKSCWLAKLPYVRSVKISRQFPTTLKVDVQEEKVLGAVYTSEGFAILSTTGKVLETKVLALREGIPRIVGLVGLTYETGGYLRKSDTKDGELLDQIKVLQEVQSSLQQTS